MHMTKDLSFLVFLLLMKVKRTIMMHIYFVLKQSCLKFSYLVVNNSYLTLVDTNKTEEYQPYILAVLKKDHWSTIKTIKK